MTEFQHKYGSRQSGKSQLSRSKSRNLNFFRKKQTKKSENRNPLIRKTKKQTRKTRRQIRVRWTTTEKFLCSHTHFLVGSGEAIVKSDDLAPPRANMQPSSFPNSREPAFPKSKHRQQQREFSRGIRNRQSTFCTRTF